MSHNVQLPLDVTTIQTLLPHRYPFLLVDRVVEFEPHKRVLAYKNVTSICLEIPKECLLGSSGQTILGAWSTASRVSPLDGGGETLTQVSRLSMPDAEEARRVTGYERGTITPLGSSRDWPVLADTSIIGEVSLGGGAHGVSLTVDSTRLIEVLGAEVADVTEPI